MPENHILILHCVVSCSPLLHALRLFTLICEISCGEELIILVFRYPNWTGGELCTLQAIGVRVGEEHLARRGHQLVCDWMMGNWVDDVVVADLENAVLVYACPGTAARLDDLLVGSVANEVGVVVVLGHGDTVFVVDGVLVSIQRRVNAQREQVLVEGGHDAGTNICSPWYGFTIFVVEGDGGQDTGCADFELDIGCLVENEGEDVFIVGYCADHLDNELAVADNCCGAGTVVCVLVLKAVVLLVHADDILEEDGLALGIGAVTVEIFNVTEAVAAQGQLVCCDTETNITDVEGLFAVVGSTRIWRALITGFQTVIRGQGRTNHRREQSSRRTTAGRKCSDHHR